MPQEISLDDSSYDEIYERAMERLRAQAPWWTHREVSDPGIMLIEMWAILSDMQSYYIDQIQESHYRKYLKLLGIGPDEGEPARTWIYFDNVGEDCTLPKGARFLSDRMVFEAEHELRLTQNSLTGFWLSDRVNRIDTMSLFRKSRFALQEGENGLLFSFALKKPVKEGEELQIYVLLDEKLKRNAAGPDFFMAELAWEYRTENGRWREAQVVEDESRGLLYSGRIGIRTDRAMASGCEIRCRIRAGAYDVMPTLYKISLNVVRAAQTNTLCCEEEAVFTADCHRAALKSYLARTGRLWILKKVEQTAQKEEEEGALWEDITERREVTVDPPITAECRERTVIFSGEGRVKIVCTAAEADPEDFVWDVTGVAAQELSLPWPALVRSSVRLMLRQKQGGKTLYRSLRRTEPEENRYDNAWHWKEEENTVVLGDGRHGDIPDAAEGGLRLTSLVLCEGRKGNVPVGAVSKWERPELSADIACTNRLPGRGGRDRMGPARQFEEAAKLLARQERMVTAEDIGRLAEETPGLLIRKAAAEWREHELVVIIFPKKELKSAYCIERYQALVREYLEQYRLAGTGLRIEIANEIE